MEYELLFFISLTNEEKIESIKKDIEEIVASSGGRIIGFTDIGKRKFAYPMKKQTHGFFSYARFNLEDKSSLSELNRKISLQEKVMRHLIVRADEIGKPVASFAEMPAPTRPQKKAREMKPVVEKKAVESKEKANLSELNEKLNEILEETPE